MKICHQELLKIAQYGCTAFLISPPPKGQSCNTFCSTKLPPAQNLNLNYILIFLKTNMGQAWSIFIYFRSFLKANTNIASKI